MRGKITSLVVLLLVVAVGNVQAQGLIKEGAQAAGRVFAEKGASLAPVVTEDFIKAGVNATGNVFKEVISLPPVVNIYTDGIYKGAGNIASETMQMGYRENMLSEANRLGGGFLIEPIDKNTLQGVLWENGGYHVYVDGMYYYMHPGGWAELLFETPEHFIRPSEVVGKYIDENGIASVQMGQPLGAKPEFNPWGAANTKTVRTADEMLQGKVYRIYNVEEGQWYKVTENGGMERLTEDQLRYVPTAGEVIQQTVSNGTVILNGVMPQTGEITLAKQGGAATTKEQIMRGSEYPIHDANGNVIGIHKADNTIQYQQPSAYPAVPEGEVPFEEIQ